MTLRFRELESSALYAGLGVQLVDEYESTPAFDASPLGWFAVELDIDDAGTWRALERDQLVSRRTAANVIWYPWLERYRDATTKPPRKYRVRVTADAYVPRYHYDAEGVEITVFPYDDVNLPASVPAAPLRIPLLTAAAYPYAPNVPILRGIVVDSMAQPVAGALVTWSDLTLQTDTVLSDADGEFSLPMRRAPGANTPINVHAERPPNPGGPSGDIIVRLPQDLPTFQTIQIS